MQTGKVLALLLVALAGCGRFDLDVYRCLNPDKGHKDANGEPDPCHRNDPAADAGPPADAGETCPGECLYDAPSQWAGPYLVWIGDEAAAPLCPEVAPFEGFTARRPPAMQPCATTCTCGPTSGSCELPATVTANSAPYPGNAPGTVHTSFDPPASWSGTCTAANAILAGELCGGVPCVQSVTIAPLTMKESACVPLEQLNVPPPTWGTFARACNSTEHQPSCAAHTEVCVPRAPGPEFKQCISMIGDPAVLHCPPSYPDKSVFYQDFMDNRFCAPCTCGAPEGGTCRASIGFFSDAACAVPLDTPTISIDATGPACVDIKPSGPALGSKSASEPIYKPGLCPVTGGQLGEIDGTLARVVCCQNTP